jgi:phage anti-repressor protein/cell division protein ZapA (FtsZ GTPase activity inhibitor)
MHSQILDFAKQHCITVDQLYIDRFWTSLYTDKWIYIDSEIISWIGYTEDKIREGKRQVLTKLRTQFEENRDFKLIDLDDVDECEAISHIDMDTVAGKRLLIVDPDVFKELLLTMNTPKAKQVQRYFIAVEKLCRKFMQAQLAGPAIQIERMPLEPNEVVYIISNNHHAQRQLYKIGKTKNLKARLASLNTSNPDRTTDRLKVFATINTYDCKSMEEMVHSHLDAYRHSDSKEWFQIDYPKLLAVVAHFQRVARESIDLVNNLDQPLERLMTERLTIEPPSLEPLTIAPPIKKNKYSCPNCSKSWKINSKFYQNHLTFCKASSS